PPPPRETAVSRGRAHHRETVRVQARRSGAAAGRMKPSRTTFQTKFFFAALSAAIIALVVAGALFGMTMRGQLAGRIESTLVADARVAAELLSRTTVPASVEELDAEADRIGGLLGARVTFIDADGRVVGDSSETLEGVAAMDNHAGRPEVVEARAN